MTCTIGTARADGRSRGFFLATRKRPGRASAGKTYNNYSKTRPHITLVDLKYSRSRVFGNTKIIQTSSSYDRAEDRPSIKITR